MSGDKLCLVLASLALLLTRTCAVPSGLLSELTGQSICQSVVEYDEDSSRIPRIIKQVKCAASPDKMCPARDGQGQVSCCSQNSYLKVSFSCTEMIDKVLVSDLNGITSPKIVSVGCACTKNPSTPAEES